MRFGSPNRLRLGFFMGLQRPSAIFWALSCPWDFYVCPRSYFGFDFSPHGIHFEAIPRELSLLESWLHVFWTCFVDAGRTSKSTAFCVVFILTQCPKSISLLSWILVPGPEVCLLSYHSGLGSQTSFSILVLAPKAMSLSLLILAQGPKSTSVSFLILVPSPKWVSLLFKF